ncbi:MAG TPA: C40 family peptidase [Ignavibacteria bacterium]|nr:C40 family peptidase [Ignavibacteria bacterium]
MSFLLISLFGLSVIISGCSSTQNLSKIEEEANLKAGVNDYSNSKNLVATNTLKEKVKIDKVNLESISSSLSRFVPSYNEKSTMERDEVMYKVIEYLNTPYLWGGTSKRGIDCSAFCQAVMYQALGISIPRTSLEQSNVGIDVAPEDLKFGDLVFFDTMNKGRVSHVGIYLEDGYFIHSGSKTGVIVASLTSDFYSRTYLKAKRVIE